MISSLTALVSAAVPLKLVDDVVGLLHRERRHRVLELLVVVLVVVCRRR